MAWSWLEGLSFLDRSFEVQVNFPASCNALYTGFALRFYRSDHECRNTAEIRDVVGRLAARHVPPLQPTAPQPCVLPGGRL